MAHHNNKFPGRSGDRVQARPYNDHNRDHDQPYRSSSSRAMNELGEFVARRLVPEIQRNSACPVHLIMNLGTLFVHEHHDHSDLNNTIVYNAPGSTMVLDTSLSSSSSRMRTIAQSSDLHSGACPGCLSRKSAWSGKYCQDCENDMRRLREPTWLRQTEPFNSRIPGRVPFHNRVSERRIHTFR